MLLLEIKLPRLILLINTIGTHSFFLNELTYKRKKIKLSSAGSV